MKSTIELESQLELARDYKLITPKRWGLLTTQVISTRRMLWSLRQKVLAKDPVAAKTP